MSWSEISSASLVTTVRVEEHQYHVGTADPLTEAPEPDQSRNGLLVPGDGVITVWTGTDMGPVNVEALFLDGVPAEVEDQWSEVVEADLVCGGGVSVMSFGYARPKIDITEIGGRFRIRVHARGRDLANGAGYVLREPLESHLVMLWPHTTALQGVAVLRSQDAFGEALGGGAS